MQLIFFAIIRVDNEISARTVKLRRVFRKDHSDMQERCWEGVFQVVLSVK